MEYRRVLKCLLTMIVTAVVIYQMVYRELILQIKDTKLDGVYYVDAIEKNSKDAYGTARCEAISNTRNIDSQDDNSAINVLKRAAFEPDITGCSVKVFSPNEETEFEEYLQNTNPNKTICTRDIFNEYFKRNRHFYGDGAWYVTDEQTGVGDFYPTNCRFSDANMASDNLEKCLKKLNISKLLISGDSNGNKYFEQLLRLFATTFTCELDATRGIEESEKYNEYFKIPDSPYIKRRPGCPHCRSQTHHCQNPDSQTNFTLEYVGIVQFIDTRVSLRGNGTFPPPFLEARTFIELLTRHYLQYRGYPDLWVISSPLHHEAWFRNLEQFQTNFTNFLNVLDRYLPQQTKVLILTDIRECPYLVPRSFIKKWLDTSSGTETRNEIFNAMNQIIFDKLKNRILNKNSRYIGFLDMGRVFCPFSCIWHTDGGHMKPDVYKLLWPYILQYMCS